MASTTVRPSGSDLQHAIRRPEIQAESDDSADREGSDSPAGTWFEAELHGWRLRAVIGAPWLLLLPVSAWLIVVNSNVFTGTLMMPPAEDVPGSILLSRIFTVFVCFHAVAATVAVFYLAFGKVEVVLQDGPCRISTGIGQFGWSESVDWDSVQAVEEGEWRPGKGGPRKLVCLRGSRNVRFARLLTEPRREFLLERLQQLHRLSADDAVHRSDDMNP